MKYMIVIVVVTALISAVITLSYRNGKQACQNEIAEAQKEILERQNAIASEPNLDVDAILKRMRENKL